MLEQVTNISRDISSAIIRSYETPRDLFKAYDQLPCINDKMLLLADIIVRRGVGSLESSRKIGFEMSKRIFTLFNSSNSKEILV